jgi:hypothetical protein
MGESFTDAALPATESRGPRIPRREQSFPRNLTICARAMWPKKTAAHLAARAGCSERAAKFYLSGDREWSAGAVSAVINALLE